jgi:hypothetical protein
VYSKVTPFTFPVSKRIGGTTSYILDTCPCHQRNYFNLEKNNFANIIIRLL